MIPRNSKELRIGVDVQVLALLVRRRGPRRRLNDVHVCLARVPARRVPTRHDGVATWHWSTSFSSNSHQMAPTFARWFARARLRVYARVYNICIYVCIHAPMYTYVCVCARTCVCVCVSVFVCVRMCECGCIWVCAWTRLRINLCLHLVGRLSARAVFALVVSLLIKLALAAKWRGVFCKASARHLASLHADARPCRISGAPDVAKHDMPLCGLNFKPTVLGYEVHAASVLDVRRN